MASIQKRETADGKARWTMRVFVGRDPKTGKRKFIVKTFDRKKDAEEEARRLEGMKDQGALAPPARVTLGAYLDEWLDRWEREGDAGARTLHDYRGIVKRYVQDPDPEAPPIRLFRLDRLTREPFEALYDFMWREKGLAPRTIEYLHAVLRVALGDAVDRGILASNPTLRAKPPKRPFDEDAAAKEAPAMSREEADRFLEAARSDRYFALWALLLTGGLRPGEALGLAWEDVDLELGRIYVQRSLTRHGVKGWRLKVPKTDKSRRSVVIPGVAVRALREWKALQARERLQLGAEYADHGHAFVFTTPFGEPLSNGNLGRRNFRRILEHAGLGTAEVFQGGGWIPEHRADPEEPVLRKRFRPGFRIYDLRRTCATLLLLRGVNPKIVQERLGHSSITLTLDTYSHVLPSMQSTAADELEAMFGTGTGG